MPNNINDLNDISYNIHPSSALRLQCIFLSIIKKIQVSNGYNIKFKLFFLERYLYNLVRHYSAKSIMLVSFDVGLFWLFWANMGILVNL